MDRIKLAASTPTSSGGPRGKNKPQGRDVEIWRAYCSGSTQEAIASTFGVTQPTVSRAVERVRASIPQEDKVELVRREVAFLDRMRAEIIQDFEAEPPPMFDQRGRAVYNPLTGQTVPDLSNRMAAFDRAIRSHERLSKLLGLDAPAKVDAAVTGEVRYVLEIENFSPAELT
jgi:transcriptional regulator with XRE-family HTH domain